MLPRFARRLIGRDVTFAHPAWLCVLAGIVLSLVGLYAIDLATNDMPPPGTWPVRASGLVARQMIFLGVGLLAAAIVAVPHFRILRWVSWPLLAVLVGLLVFLLIPFVPASIVRPRNGARCWIELGAFDFQPGELAKLAAVLAIAEFLRFRQNHRRFTGLVIPVVIAAVPAALITLQPDLGMAALFAPMVVAMLLVAGAKKRHLAMGLAATIAVAPLAYPFLRPHQKGRIEALVASLSDPEYKAEGINYQPIRARMLSGAGGVWGLSDTKTRALHTFNDLPERHNDMVLAVILTRFGLVGGLALIGLYALWFLGAYASAALSKDAFGQLVIVGIATILFVQTFVNMGMVIGLLPIIGLTLPFVSYGGTSIVTVWLMTGIIVGIAMRPASRLARPSFEFGTSPYDPVESALTARITPESRSSRPTRTPAARTR